ncbi:hypothetical protein [Kitasatospora phosalacinea]|uniref:hypothetical protein n=1 Tax=Kitasatospora phosalacinea TaxID=2065 RepID=UPI001F3E72D7|nr:hypothetical protein [Kitasatospora phosalacinea]
MPSAEPDVPFVASFTALWRPVARHRVNLPEQVRSDLRSAASAVTAELPPDDLLGAEDTLNAALGVPGSRRAPHYRLLSVKFSLRLSPSSQEVLAARRADVARIRRLEFLKTALYERPDLLVLDHLERTSELPEEEVLAELQRLSRSIKSCGAWWQPLLEVWESLGAGFGDVEIRHKAMEALLQLSAEALRAATAPPGRASPDGRVG